MNISLSIVGGPVARAESCWDSVRDLEYAILYEIPTGECLSSCNARFEDVSFAKFLATGIRDTLQCDCAVINSGTIRGNKEYHDSPDFHSASWPHSIHVKLKRAALPADHRIWTNFRKT